MPFLFAGYTSKLPADFSESDFVLLANGFAEYDDPAAIPPHLICYQLAVISVEPDTSAAVTLITDTWRDTHGTTIRLELIESRPSHMVRVIRASLKRLPAGAFFMRGPLGFCNQSEEAYTAALDNIRQTFVRQPWQFWR